MGGLGPRYGTMRGLVEWERWNGGWRRNLAEVVVLQGVMEKV